MSDMILHGCSRHFVRPFGAEILIPLRDLGDLSIHLFAEQIARCGDYLQDAFLVMDRISLRLLDPIPRRLGFRYELDRPR